MGRKWNDADLSAYMDGQLGPNQTQALESALKNNRELQTRLGDMQRVSAMVRSMPTRETPRNYLLNPGMVTEKTTAGARRYRAPLFMRVATSLTAAAFMITMGLNVYMSQGMSSLSFAMQDSPAMELYAEATPEMVMEKEVAAIEPEAAVPEARVVEATEEPEPIEENRDILTGMRGDDEPEDGDGIYIATSPPAAAAPEGTALPQEEVTVAEGDTTSDNDSGEAGNTIMADEAPQLANAPTIEYETPVAAGSDMPAEIELLSEPPDVDGLPRPSEAWHSSDTLLPKGLPWALGGITLVLGFLTWWMDRQRR